MSKKDSAVSFINGVHEMDPAALNRLIVAEAGEDLAEFMFRYAATVLGDGSVRGVENASSLMLLGYLLAKAESRKAAEAFGQKGAAA